MQRLSATVVGFCVLALAAPVAASAQATQTFSTSVSEFTAGVRNQGWWSRVTDNFDANDNYGVATFGGNEPINRNFFTFDLSTACRASAGTLDLTRFEQIGPLTYSLFDVSTPARTLNANNGFGGSIFDDLGTGVSYGTFVVTPGEPADVLSSELNSAGVDALTRLEAASSQLAARPA